MSPLSPVVLGAAALVTSPALWAFGVEGSLALDQALTRYLVAVGICWVLLSVLTELALKPAPSTTGTGQGEGDTAALDAPAATTT